MASGDIALENLLKEQIISHYLTKPLQGQKLQ